ncbi:1-phosphatidylinositol 4,5-bisphosphate phosphodiesterase delta-3-A isoform X1 [Lepisosteus oculatus]|uniref:1-phosphatidylinositol 4,5-bisphosphate phosphodiesterase delta-3-A isoform X1 n=2 Tax=Lepisosteus oculatus TaxID=7918 RepID=UPI0037159AAE
MFRKNKKDRVLENEAGKSECKQDLRALRKLGVMEDADVQAMLRGTSMVKVRSASWQKSRLLRLLEDGMTVWLESKKRLRRAAAQQTFSVLEVDCVREGCQSEALRGLEGSAPEQQCFTVVFRGGKRKSLDLRGGSSEEVQCWVRGLRKLQERALSMSQRDMLEHWIYGYLRRADLNKDGKMSYEEVGSLLKMINIELNEQYARCLFKQCDRSANGRLENSEIAEFCRRLMRRPELEAVFWKYSGNDSALSAKELREFLWDQGEEQATLAHAHAIIQTYELSDRAKKSQFMTMDGFTMYLLSSESNVFNPAHATVSQDMTQPLAHYFISASHNTYLTKDQITSMSSTEPYIRALNQGCRCVELDCWDGDKGEPVICHGHTLTSKIPFREVIQTIAQYAFKASPYPLILSLENHCTVEQQAVMARHLRTLLGDSLVTKPISGQLSSSLPSPEELKGRILVKGKKETGQQVKTDSAGSSSGSEDEMVGRPGNNKNKEVAKAGTSKLSPELSELVVYCRSTPFRGFEQAAQLPNEMSSFSESEAQRHIKESGTAFVQHNTRQLSRIYPSGQRIQSSNYNPQDMWNCGCQIVALNFQTPGEQMDLNQGRFLPNGHCGYILKPAFLRAENSTFDPENPLQGPGYQPTQLTIKVISAQQLPKLNTDKPNSIVDPLVRIEVHGVSSDTTKAETPYITNNGFNPLWNCTLSFKIQVPELALIRFVVEDHDMASSNDFVGQFTLPFTSLRRGFRHVHLLKEDGCSLSPATLFIHVKVSALGSTKPVSP